MKVIVDRIEGKWVICEIYASNEMISIKKSVFPAEIFSGDLFEFDGKTVAAIENDFLSQRIQKKMNDLWK